MRLFLIRYTKIAFTWLRLHVFFNLFSGLNANLLYLSRFSAWAAKNRKIAYNDFPSRWDYQKRYPFYQWVLEKEALLSEPVNYLEFGVADGFSFRWFLEKLNHPHSSFCGFDTFTGLPEDFGVYKKGTFNSGKNQPEINDSRGNFYQGLDNSRRNIIMMDADLYSATLFVLTSLAPFLKKGDIIFFDEFAVPTHEYKAFSDFVQSYYLDLELIAAANNYYFTAFKVK
jgi:O-methyltransferase